MKLRDWYAWAEKASNKELANTMQAFDLMPEIILKSYDSLHTVKKIVELEMTARAQRKVSKWIEKRCRE